MTYFLFNPTEELENFVTFRNTKCVLANVWPKTHSTQQRKPVSDAGKPWENNVRKTHLKGDFGSYYLINNARIIAGLLKVPKMNLSTMGERVFSHTAQKLLNSVPNNNRHFESTAQFKKELKTNVFKLAYWLWYGYMDYIFLIIFQNCWYFFSNLFYLWTDLWTENAFQCPEMHF